MIFENRTPGMEQFYTFFFRKLSIKTFFVTIHFLIMGERWNSCGQGVHIGML
jgi:hypothetical protein